MTEGTDDTRDFDAWLASTAPAVETVTIFGQEVPVPTSISLGLSMRIEEADTEDTALLSELVAEMYGAGEFERWRATPGCDTRAFAVLLAWGSARANGQDIGFDEAAEIVARRRAEAASGKAPGTNRAQRRAAKKRKRR